MLGMRIAQATLARQTHTRAGDRSVDARVTLEMHHSPALHSILHSPPEGRRRNKSLPDQLYYTPMSKVFLDIDIGDAAAWQQATDAHARATEFLRSAGHQVTMIACRATCIRVACAHAEV